MLSVRNLRKVYKSKKAESVVALNDVSIDFPETGFVFLLGKSGSGKSTLLNAIGGLDKFDSGEIIIKGKSSKDFSQSDFDSYRNTFIGFIFQEYNILENFSVSKNLALALELQHKKADKAEVMKLLEQVDMQNYANRKPNELSGGQKQRVAIARALIKNPEIIMADEPTGALDSNTGKQVMDTLKELSKTKLVIVVSHDRDFAEIYGDRIIELKDGNIISDVTKKEVVAQETKSGIKIIDNDIVYIKKGQEVTANELRAISEIITNKTKDSDAFISFDSKANQKLKEGAKINDSGNKEKFMQTEKEDIKVKDYNPSDLKLIRSHLGFKDSFKMGASSLKNKVGKLIFTIFLSFFAFTVFGIVDALSQWNRASSVYEAIKMTNQQNIVMQKQKQVGDATYSYNNSVSANDDDLNMFKEKYPDYVVKGVVGSGNSSDLMEIKVVVGSNTKDLTSTRNPFKTAGLGGFLTLTNEELEKLGFTINGRLPNTDTEIAISKFVAENIISGSAKFDEANKVTEANILNKTISISSYSSSYSEAQYKIVGIIDDGTDFSNYNSKTEEELSKNSWQYMQVVKYSWASLGFVTENVYNKLKNTNDSDCLYYQYSNEDGYNSLYKSRIQAADSFLTGEDSGKTYYLSSDEKTVLSVKDSEYYLETSQYRYNYYYYGSGSDENYVYAYNKTTRNYESMDVNELENLYPGVKTNGIPTGFTLQSSYSLKLWLVSNMYACYGNIADYINADGSLNLKDDEIIVNIDSFYNGLDDFATKIKEGTLFITITEDTSSSSPEIKKLKVVGVASFSGDSSNKLVVSKETANLLSGYYGSYNFLASKLTGTDDESFVKTCETFSKDKVKFTIQNSATPILDEFEGIISSTAKIFLYIAIAFAVFAALLLMNFISTSISYKKREIGVLRALGARGIDVFGIFLNESTIIALINFALATIATIIGSKIINAEIIKGLGVAIPLINVGIRQIVLILVVSWGSAFLASLIPTSKISNKKPIDAINNR